MKRILLFMYLLLMPSLAQAACLAATCYIDNVSPCIGAACNGTSWALAWKGATAITGVVPGDTIYISGGPSGQTYIWPNGWVPPSGSAIGGPITLAVGQDAAHNGMVTFTASPSGALTFMRDEAVAYFTLNGEVNGQRRMTIANTFFHIAYADGNNNDKHIRILYIEAQGDTISGPLIKVRGDYWEIAYCSITTSEAGRNSPALDIIIQFPGLIPVSRGWGHSSIHHNFFKTFHATSNHAQGFDGMATIDSIDVHDNIMISVDSTVYTTNPLFAQHPDGIQFFNGQYVRIYNNYFEGFVSYNVFQQLTANGGHVRIFNNVFNSTGANIGHYGILIEPQAVSNHLVELTDYIIANNTIIGSPNTTCIMLTDGPPGANLGGILVPDNYIVNNLCYNFDLNALGARTTEPTSIPPVISNNKFGTTNLTFVSNALYPNNNFRLTSSAIAAIDLAISPAPSYLTSEFTTDAAGVARPQGAAWDVGAYEFSGVDLVAPAAPTNITVQ